MYRDDLLDANQSCERAGQLFRGADDSESAEQRADTSPPPFFSFEKDNWDQRNVSKGS